LVALGCTFISHWISYVLLIT